MHTKCSITANRSPAPASVPVPVVPADVIAVSAGANSGRVLDRFASLLNAAPPDQTRRTAPGEER